MSGGGERSCRKDGSRHCWKINALTALVVEAIAATGEVIFLLEGLLVKQVIVEHENETLIRSLCCSSSP